MSLALRNKPKNPKIAFLFSRFVGLFFWLFLKHRLSYIEHLEITLIQFFIFFLHN